MAMKFQYHGWDRQKNVAKLTGQWNPMMIVQPIKAVLNVSLWQQLLQYEACYMDKKNEMLLSYEVRFF